MSISAPMASKSLKRSDETIVTFGRLPDTTAAVILAMNSGFGIFSGVTLMSGCAALNSAITLSRPACSDWLVKVCQ